MEEVKAWYDGYSFAMAVLSVYSPRSVVNSMRSSENRKLLESDRNIRGPAGLY